MGTLLTGILALVGFMVLLPLLGSIFMAIVAAFGPLLIVVVALLLLGAVIGRMAGKKK